MSGCIFLSGANRQYQRGAISLPLRRIHNQLQMYFSWATASFMLLGQPEDFLNVFGVP
jgi:hypothetical protein